MDGNADQQSPDQVIEDYMVHWNSRIGEARPAPVGGRHGMDCALQLRHVTRDMIRTFARTNGDPNPIWSEPAYAERSPWGGIIAPPLFEATVAEFARMPEPPPVKGWRYFQGGTLRRFHKPFRPGDVIDADDVWLGIEEHSKADRPHRMFISRGERRYRNQDGVVLCSIENRIYGTMPRAAGSTASGSGSRGVDRKRRRYSDDELQAIYSHYDDELAGKFRRGSSPRFWEDVREGDELGPVLKGPYDIFEAASFIGLMGIGMGNAEKWAAIREGLSGAPRDPETGAYHFGIDWHLSDEIARAAAPVPYAPNFGTLMEMNLVHAVTNWHGDHGFLRETDIRIPASMFMGDTLKITGKVARTFETEGRGLAEILLHGVEQNGLELINARVVVQLPHKGRPDEVVQEVLSAGGAP